MDLAANQPGGPGVGILIRLLEGSCNAEHQVEVTGRLEDFLGLGSMIS